MTLDDALDAADEILADERVAAVLFGARARGDSERASDYDVLLLTRRAPSEETLLQLELASQNDPPVRFAAHSLDEVRRGLNEAHVPFIDMLSGRRIALRGAVPEDLDRLATEVRTRYGLKPAPWVGKGVWIADRDLPIARTRAELERARATGHPEARVDRLLRALLHVRVRGDLTLERRALLALLAAHVLGPRRTAELEQILNDPAAVDGFVAKEVDIRR